MNMTSLQYFRAVADEMSFSRAAEKCFISQQAISQHISKLEKEFQMKLFQRTPRLRLTDFGRLIYDYAVEMSYEENRLHGKIHDLWQEVSGTVTVGMTANKSTRLVPPIFRHFHSRYPQVLLRFVDGATSDLVKKFLNHEIDFLVMTSELDNPSITYREICEQIFLLFVSEEIIDTYCEDPLELKSLCGKNVSLERFRNCPFLLYPEGYWGRRVINPVFSSLHITPRTILESSNAQVLEALVTQKTGAAIIPGDAVSNALIRNGPGNGILHYRIQELRSRRATKVYFHRDMYFTAYCNNLMQMIELVLNKGSLSEHPSETQAIT